MQCLCNSSTYLYLLKPIECATLNSFSKYLQTLSATPLYVLSPSIPLRDYCFLDLSVTNEALKDVDLTSPTAMQNYIDSDLKINNAKVSYGGYLEQRNLYKRSTYFSAESNEKERNIHLGLDLWIASGTQIFAPLDGKLHSFNNNTNHGDYGPTLILKHLTNDVEFYTLYGHLSLESLNEKTVGQTFKKGDSIATLGEPNVNGDYAPHLHFQIIKDLEGNHGDYPGVASPETLEHYKTNCPDPNLLLKIR